VGGDWIISGAWENCKFNGAARYNVDLKIMNVLLKAEEKGWLPNEEIAQSYFNTDFETNIRKLAHEKRISAGVLSNVSFGADVDFDDDDDDEKPSADNGQKIREDGLDV
jgi:hypothetical protein